MIRRLDHERGGDQRLVRTLLQEHLGADEDVEARYAWLYLQNPHGQARTYLATDRRSGEAAGLTSLFPRRVLVSGRMRTGAIGGDGYVRPAFRRRGIATMLHKAALADMAESGVDFMYGPPAPHNLRALLHAGSTVTGWAQRHIRALRPEALLKGRRVPGVVRGALSFILGPPPSRLRLVPLPDRPDPRVDEVFFSAVEEEDEIQVMPVRDAVFYAWRFARSPTRRQEPLLVVDGDRPVGLCVLERGGRRAALVDLVCPRHLRREVLRGVLHVLDDVEAVEFQVHTPARGLQRTLHALGFIPRDRKPFQVQARPDHPEREVLQRPSSWYYVWGDGDVDHVF